MALDSLIRVRIQEVRKDLDNTYKSDGDMDITPEVNFLEGKLEGLEEVLDMLKSNKQEENKI